ncbi:hypothetical protein AS026_30215 [Rhizobium altiplani]|uniref:Uncharacterized protein n=1 Tax=Rhizobium altiplani TaxID=1864509 RepID=A0A109K0X7_9HYPH|nr:hypothetical protein AS026_30215 [Rhizobium altiplani]
MGDDQHRAAFLGERTHDAQNLADELGIERGSRLVEEHDFRPHREGPCDCGPLLLAARKVGRMKIALLSNADLGKQRFGGSAWRRVSGAMIRRKRRVLPMPQAIAAPISP